MKPAITALAAALLAAGGTAAFLEFGARAPDDSAAKASDEVKARVEAMEQKLGAIAESVGTLARQSAAVPQLRLSDAELDAAVARALERADAAGPRAAGRRQGGSATGAGGDAETAATAEDFDLSAALARLADKETSHEDAEALWKAIAAAGQLDAAIDGLAELVEADPTNPELRVDLGNAYLQKLFTVGDGPEKGVLAMQADASFDTALKIDPRHWEARFTKAVSLSFWPPLFGKQNEAIKQFQTLCTQQEESGALQPHFANTYMFLGNLYEQQGQAAKAKEIWNKGAALYPQNGELAEKLAAANGQ